MNGPPSMTAEERIELLDTAMRSSDPQAHLSGVCAAFEDAGRSDDAVVAMLLRALLLTGEIETLMFMRDEWRGRSSALAQFEPKREDER